VIYSGSSPAIYVVGDSPFDHPTAGQYVGSRGPCHCSAFVVGYDPTKFQDFIKIIPKTRANATGPA